MSGSFASRAVVDALSRHGELVSVASMPDEFSGLSDDSRRVIPGSLFVAVRGTVADGHAFLPAAAAAGAAAAIAEGSTADLPAIVVRDSRRAAAIAARVAFGDPAGRLTIVGVTGTNGKTTTVGVLRHLLDDPDAPAASIGTLGVLRGSRGEAVPGGSGLTTPGVIELYRLLRLLADGGIRRVAMEVSSHSLDQRRVEGVAFRAGVFTNVTRDHLDYHGTMEAYVAAKAKLVDHVESTGAVVVNAEDRAWDVLPRARRLVTFGITRPADVAVRDLRWTAEGSEWTIVAGDEQARVQLPLLGAFNVENAIAAAAAAWVMGVPVARIAHRLSSVPQVVGRLERLADRPTVLRDYAHTPDALDRVLAAVRPSVRGRLIVVFGCGGDRDRGKRPLMGAIAEAKADFAVVTSDNPRTEDPERILDEIEAGMRGANHDRIEDRRAAIAHALAMAGADDVVLLAGKGHETYQIRGTTSFPFDEREVVRALTRQPVGEPC